MKQVIKLTLLASLSSCIIMVVIWTITNSYKMALSVGLLTFGNILLPTLGAVLIYFTVKRWTTLVNPICTMILQATLLTGLFIVGLSIWATGEAATHDALTWIKITEVFDSEFTGFLPIVILEAILIPTFDVLLIGHGKMIDA